MLKRIVFILAISAIYLTYPPSAWKAQGAESVFGWFGFDFEDEKLNAIRDDATWKLDYGMASLFHMLNAQKNKDKDEFSIQKHRILSNLDEASQGFRSIFLGMR